MERIVVAPDLEIRPAHFLALARGRALQLSVRELELLTALARRPSRVVRRPLSPSFHMSRTDR